MHQSYPHTEHPSIRFVCTDLYRVVFLSLALSLSLFRHSGSLSRFRSCPRLMFSTRFIANALDFPAEAYLSMRMYSGPVSGFVISETLHDATGH